MESSTELYEQAEGAEASANGSSIEDLATEEESQGTSPITGTSVQLSLIAGGEEPTSATMKLRGGAIPVEGEFEKGDFIELRVLARVAEVHFVDQIDTSGYVLGAERRHVARIDSVQRVGTPA